MPKAESASDLTVFGGLEVIALIETALGTINAAEIAAAPNVHGLMWGSEDLIADLGGGSSRRADGTWRDVVSTSAARRPLAARAHGKHALDSIWADIPDLDGLREEAEDACESGFSGKVSIHPNHVPVVREAFRPSDEQLEWARAVLDLARTEKGRSPMRGR